MGRKVVTTLAQWFAENPQVATEWDSEANTELDVNTTGHAVRKKAWWKCEKGHKWQAMIYTRTRPNPPGCPVCAGLRAYAGYNDLATTRPDILSKWDYEKNTDVSPTEITESSHTKVWWKCENGHSWYARVQSVTGLKTDKSGCPYCSKVRVYTGESDLLTRFPELAKEWCYDLNDTPPDKVSYTSPKYYWWKCEEGHTWESSVSSRTKSKLGCPYCSGRRAIPGVNDLATVNPQLASEWHDELNGDLKPTDVFPGTHKKAWWKCAEGHVWEAYIPARALNKKTGCPYCAGRKPKDKSKTTLESV